MPLRSIVPALTRATRDAAQALGREVELEIAGADVRLEASVVMALRDALLHVVRNAVTHGIEPPAVRVAAGKPARGTITLTLIRRGDQLTLRCDDDGRGFDRAAIRAAAIARGVAVADDAADDELLALLRGGGVSTAGGLSELAGRGIGLDVVAEAAARLGGSLRLRTGPAGGATVELRVPVSISSVLALLVEVVGGVVAIPLHAVRRTVRITGEDVVHTAARDAVVLDGVTLPLLGLARALRRAEPPARGHQPTAVVVLEVEGASAAVTIRRVVGPATVVVRRLPAVVDADPIVAGAALDAEGRPVVVLDPAALIGRGRSRPAPCATPATSRPACRSW